MSRERPAEPPRVVPDQQRGRALKPHQVREREQLARLASTHGPGLLAGFFSRLDGSMPQFIRRGYESNILEDLKAFYTARPRPWRPASRSSCGPTSKERLKLQRRGANRAA